MTELAKIRSLSWQKLCSFCGVPYGTVKRWRGNARDGKVPVKKPGPKPSHPPSPAALKQQIEQLQHGPKRSKGSGGFHALLEGSMSRRDRQKAINKARKKANREHREKHQEVNWTQVNAGWAVDDVEITSQVRTWLTDAATLKKRVHINTVRELASRYLLPHDPQPLLAGEEVAKRLDTLFRQHGPPLVLKRDTHSNLDNRWVNATLAEHGVAALDSPVGYPEYNGSVEQAQKEIHQKVGELMAEYRPCADNWNTVLRLIVRVAFNELNHKPRPVMRKRTSCTVFHSPEERVHYGKRQRHRMLAEIQQRTIRIAPELGDYPQNLVPARRLAVTQWLQQEGYITTQKNDHPRQKVLPDLAPETGP